MMGDKKKGVGDKDEVEGEGVDCLAYQVFLCRALKRKSHDQIRTFSQDF